MLKTNTLNWYLSSKNKHGICVLRNTQERYWCTYKHSRDTSQLTMKSCLVLPPSDSFVSVWCPLFFSFPLHVINSMKVSGVSRPLVAKVCNSEIDLKDDGMKAVSVKLDNAGGPHILLQRLNCRVVSVALLICVAASMGAFERLGEMKSTTTSTSPSENGEPFVPENLVARIVSSGGTGGAFSPRCSVTTALVNDVPVGDILSSANVSYINACRQAAGAAAGAGTDGGGTHYRAIRDCTGINEHRQAFRTDEWENRLRRYEDPILMPMHGGVVPSRMARLAVQLSRHCPTPPLEQPHLWPNETVIVELGCGNAALLSVVAPRAPHIVGVGTDVAKSLVEHGSIFYPHLAVHRAIGAPMVPAGAATCVYSLGVLMLLTTSATCNYIAEGLRVLHPGGRMILHGVPRRFPKVGVWTTFRNAFFEKVVYTNNATTEGNAPDIVFLPVCSDIGRLVRRVTFLTSKHLAIYPPGEQFMSVVVERNDAPFPCTTTSATSSSAWPNSITKPSFMEGERARRANRTAANDGGNNTSEVLFPPEWSSRRLHCLLSKNRPQC
jgi:hypothetical protein